MHPLGEPVVRARALRTPSRAARIIAGACATLMIWSVLGSSDARGAAEPTEEPSDLSAYATLGDAMPVQGYFDHQARLVPLGPAIAHSQTEVSMPSQGSGIAWLVDNGVANGLHGTTTGNKVPTEASAKQPGGESEAEFKVAGGPIGDDAFMRVNAGRAFARATSAGSPEGYANSYLGNLLVLPAAGSPEDPPGTFDPDASFPGEQGTDPNPMGQMAILSIGQIASTSRSVRDGSTVTSIAVAELKDVNIGNRTSDNRCTNCMRFDSIRAEAYASANGTKGGSKAAYRVTLGRACRRSFDAETGQEADRCLPLNPQDPEGNDGLRSIDQVDALNGFFEEPIWYQISGGAVDYMIGVRIHAGDRHRSDARARRTASPKDDAERNYASADPNGEEASALAEGFDVEIWTITLTQAVDDAQARIKGTPAEALIAQIDADDEAPGIQIPTPVVGGDQTIPIDTVRSVRRVQMTLGVARALATARPGFGVVVTPGDGGAPAPGLIGGVPAEPPGVAPGDAGSVDGSRTGGGSTTGLAGPLTLKINWSSFRIKPWAPGDMAKAIASALIAMGALVLLRRRLGMT